MAAKTQWQVIKEYSDGSKDMSGLLYTFEAAEKLARETMEQNRDLEPHMFVVVRCYIRRVQDVEVWEWEKILVRVTVSSDPT